ncbi:MAG: acylphosphatase [Bacteroidota bacterium]
MIKHYKIKVTGRVQGVWYRGSTQHKARELGIRGIVKNEPDGSVYIEAEGEEAVVAQLITWCQKGPELARVKNVEAKEGDVCDYRNFEILR